MTHSIRRARPEDAPALAAVHIGSWRAAYRGLLPDAVLADLDGEDLTARWKAEIATQDVDVRIWVVDEGDERIAAYARTGDARDRDSIVEGGTGEIYGFYVEPSRWGAGVGRALMDHVVDDLSRRGYSRVTLNVVEGNERALAFYERAGFSPDRTASPWYGAPQVRYLKEL